MRTNKGAPELQILAPLCLLTFARVKAGSWMRRGLPAALSINVLSVSRYQEAREFNLCPPNLVWFS